MANRRTSLFYSTGSGGLLPPAWEWSAIAMFWWYQPSSLGYSFSATDHCIWIHFNFEPAAIQAICDQNNDYCFYEEESKAILDPSAIRRVSSWCPSHMIYKLSHLKWLEGITVMSSLPPLKSPLHVLLTTKTMLKLYSGSFPAPISFKWAMDCYQHTPYITSPLGN